MSSEISFARRMVKAVYPRYSSFVDKVNRTPAFVRFVAEHPSPLYPTRHEMFDAVIDKVAGQPIDYLEFGVWKGESLKYWAQKIADRNSQFVGFDTFTGLPEAWDYRPAGTFDVDGALPVIDDDRVSLVKGLFQETLPGFLETFTPKNRLVVHLDADLYSATLYVLARIHHLIAPGTILMFDEFGDVQHEFRAFHDYVSSHVREYRALGGTSQYYTMAFEITS